MIKTTSMILDELKDYVNPTAKLSRMVRLGNYTQIVRGLYETDPSTPGYLLAGSIYGPSYLSFDFALDYYNLIPEAVYVFTSATFDKKKKKTYETSFGKFVYRDIPKEVYPFEVELAKEGEYYFQIASPEKAICDKLYSLSPVKNMKEMYTLLTDYLRIEHESLEAFQYEKIETIYRKYHSANVDLFAKVLRRMRGIHEQYD